MALDPLELGVIALMAIAVFIWGPDKIPPIAKQIASARKQLEVYTKQLQGVTKEIQTSMTTGNMDNLGNVLSNFGAGEQGQQAAQAPPGSLAAKAAGIEPAASIAGAAATAALPGQLRGPKPTTMSADELLIDMAHKLGISTQGKTRDELQDEIIQKSSFQPQDAQATASAGDPRPIEGADLV